jgi:hypothetical protein
MQYGPEHRQAVLDGLASGKSLADVCEGDGLPDRKTIQRWQDDDEAFDVAVMRAREAGFLARADAAVDAAKKAEDAGKGRLAFDAERWYLGKLSNAFSDNKPQSHKVEHDLSNRAREWLGLTPAS